MVPQYLKEFNNTLAEFRKLFPVNKWTPEFRDNLINDYSFFSSRVEDPKLQYGETIRFLNGETIRGANFKSLTGISKHQAILKNIIDYIDSFNLSEDSIKNIHRTLMEDEEAWEAEFRKELIGNYRNIPTVGSRQPLFEDKEYAPHFNLEIIMASNIDFFNRAFEDIDNNIEEKHILNRVAYFHNKFLNEIHPFADGNGRVCRIIIGTILMKNNCPPIFPEIKTTEEQIEYITTIMKCEQTNSDEPLTKYFALGMTEYLKVRIDENRSSK